MSCPVCGNSFDEMYRYDGEGVTQTTGYARVCQLVNEQYDENVTVYCHEKIPIEIVE